MWRSTAHLAVSARDGAGWSLLYGGRSRASMAFVDQLEALGEQVAVRPQDECGLLDLDSLLAAAEPETLVYCCGPEPLLAAVEERCGAWPTGAVHFERFKPKVQSVRDAEEEQACTAVLQRSGCTVEVPAGRSILEAMVDAGMEADNSCREGIYGDLRDQGGRRAARPSRQPAVRRGESRERDDDDLRGPGAEPCASSWTCEPSCPGRPTCKRRSTSPPDSAERRPIDLPC